MGFSMDASDPFAAIIAPPANETPEDKATRVAREAEAQRVSDAIDEDIRKERAALKKEKNVVKVLLLGQSESGKSTTLKNFRMKYAPEAWKAERSSWRAVIQLNLIRSINLIAEALHAEMTGTSADDEEGNEQEKSTPFTFTDKHQLLKLRLRPLTHVERDLKRRLGVAAEELDEDSHSMYATPFDARSTAGSRHMPRSRRKQELFVRSWENALDQRPSPNSSQHGHGHGHDYSDSATDVIAGCQEDMKALWTDEVVHDILAKRKIRLEDSAGFFLNDVDRIATRTYDPSDDDVVRARLRTLGVQEHRLRFEQGAEIGREWALFDIGGSRTMRAAWLPFFDKVDAIIFLAPISCFDERLAEDPKVNRLEDTFILWKSICSSKLLSKTAMVLFLNKCDILERKLKNGLMVRKWLTSFGDRENEINTVVKYLRAKFKDILMQHSPEPRLYYIFSTSVTDTHATAITLSSVRDGILRSHLKQADLV